MKVKLENVRLSFPALWEPEAMDADSKPRYKANFLLPADHPQVEEIEKVMAQVAIDKWGPKAKALHEGFRKTDKLCLHDGDTKPTWGGYEDMLFVSSASPGDGPAPTVVDRDPRVRLTPKDGRPYAGCYVNAVVDIYAQDNGFGKRINASLSGVQFFKDGDSFGGGRPASPDDFETLDEEGAEADDFA